MQSRLLCAATVLAIAPIGMGAVNINEQFGISPVGLTDPNLEVQRAGSLAFPAGGAFASGLGSKGFVRTLASDYGSTAFVATAVFQNVNQDTVLFLGLGSAVSDLDAGQGDEMENSFFIKTHKLSFLKDVRSVTTGAQAVTNQSILNSTAALPAFGTTFVLQMEKDALGNVINRVDVNGDGVTFGWDYLWSTSYAALPANVTSTSKLFVGVSPNATIDSFAVTGVPEPASVVTLGLGLCGLLLRRRA